MVIKQYGFNVDDSLMKKVDDIVKKNNKYKDRTQFIVLAIENLCSSEVKDG